VEQKFSAIRKTFGPGNSALLKINSLPADKPQVVDGQSTFLSSEDRKGLQTFMYDIIFRGIIPHLEQRIINLEEHVASTRKSFKNSMKSLFRFGSKPKPVPESVPELSPSGITMYVVPSRCLVSICSELLINNFCVMF
jgi:hypothetical protein